MQELVAIASLGSVYLLFALGLSTAWGTIGILNFAHGAIFVSAAYGCYELLEVRQLPVLVLAVVAVLIGAAMSLLMQVLVFDQVRRRASSERAAETRILIGGIGVAMLPIALASHQTKNLAFGLSASGFEASVWTIGGVRVSSVQVATVVCAVGAAAALAWYLRRTRAGLALRSLGVDDQVAALMGIDRRRYAWATMAVAGGLAGLAGVLLTLNLGAISAESGDALLIKAFACVVLGGVGSTLGVVVGCFTLAASEVWVLTQTSGMWVEAVSFGIIFAVLLLRPQGIFGRQEVRRV
ncbi:ABC transporter permease subunit [Nocardioides zeae]|uniref:Branched-chain amino acid ABC transporter permease n=1 Tax=Nocardioides zeae TaxID=1457234 RepID=A0A6P0HQ96_9ACTN|nr:branched-chain amino acid ABC transporter permease [Nocardioides zeae]